MKHWNMAKPDVIWLGTRKSFTYDSPNLQIWVSKKQKITHKWNFWINIYIKYWIFLLKHNSVKSNIYYDFKNACHHIRLWVISKFCMNTFYLTHFVFFELDGSSKSSEVLFPPAESPLNLPRHSKSNVWTFKIKDFFSLFLSFVSYVLVSYLSLDLSCLCRVIQQWCHVTALNATWW